MKRNESNRTATSQPRLLSPGWCGTRDGIKRPSHLRDVIHWPPLLAIITSARSKAMAAQLLKRRWMVISVACDAIPANLVLPTERSTRWFLRVRKEEKLYIVGSLLNRNISHLVRISPISFFLQLFSCKKRDLLRVTSFQM